LFVFVACLAAEAAADKGQICRAG